MNITTNISHEWSVLLFNGLFNVRLWRRRREKGYKNFALYFLFNNLLNVPGLPYRLKEEI